MKRQTAALLLTVVALSGIGIAAVNTTPTTGTIPVADDNAPVVYVTGGQNINFNSYSNSPSTTLITTDNNEIAVTGSDGASIRVDDIEGTYTNTSQIDTDNGVLTIDPDDKLPATVNDSVEEFDFRNSTADDGVADFRYDTGSANGANITVSGLTPGYDVGAIDASSGALLDVAQVDQNGQATFDQLEGGDRRVTVQRRPANLSIRDEQNPSNLVTNANVEVQFFVQGSSGSTNSFTRSTTNGQVDMSGLPADEDFVAVVSASGWVERQIYIDSLYEQQTVYLLNESANQVDRTFEYTDYSGNYPQENTVLIFERSINGDYRAISGDVIGGTGEYRVTLESGQRYQIRLLNRQTGQTRIQGPYSSTVTGTQELEVFSNNEIQVSALGPLLNYSPSTGAVRERQTTFEVGITSRESAVDTATVTLYRRTNGQLTQLDQSNSNGAGTVTVSDNLSGYNDSTAVVETQYELADGTTDTVYRNYSIRQLYDNENSLLNVLSGISGLIPAGNLGSFQTTAAVFASLLLSAGASARVGLSGEGFATIMVAGLAGFSVIGWVAYGVVFAAGVGVGALVFIRRGL